jgi:hypothetical protein
LKCKQAVKEVQDKKSAGDDDVPADVLKAWRENGLKIMPQVINNIHETGEWPRISLKLQ